MPDMIDAAIEAATQAEVEPPFRVNVTLASTQRVVSIEFPKDINESELIEFVGWLGTVMVSSIRQWAAASKPPPIEIARAMPAGLVGPDGRPA